MPRMSSARARERFAAQRIARLATVGEAGRPHLVPVVFAVTRLAHADGVVFAVDHKPKRSARLRRLDNIRARPAVCLLADVYDEDWRDLWWVRADGHGRVLPPPAEAETAADAETAARHVGLLAEKYREQYAGSPPRGPVVEVAVSRWSGWSASEGA